MSQRTPEHRAEPDPRPAWRRRLLVTLGAVAALGGLGWSASAAATGWFDSGDQKAAAAPAAATPEEAAQVQDTATAVGAWLDLADGLTAEDAVSDDLVFGAGAFAADSFPGLAQALDYAQGRLEALAADPATTPAVLDAKLDDLDEDGDDTSDFDGIPGLAFDFDGDVETLGGGTYDVKVTATARLAKDSALAMRLDGLRINKDKVGDTLSVKLQSTLRLNRAAAGAKKVTLKVGPDTTLGSVRVDLTGSFQGDDALAFNAGILGVKATGSVRAEGGVAVKLLDPDHDGFLDLSELTGTADVFEPTCVSEGAQVDLTVTTDLAGLTGQAGTITLDDKSLCNGLAAPDVKLADLGKFRQVTLGDFINGLAQVTQALQTAQDAGDLDIPFVKEPLRDLLHANEKLVAFFVDNGFTDPASPMATITVDTAEDAPLKTIQDVAPALAEALGVDLDALGLHFTDGRVLLDVTAHPDEDKPAKSVSLDFGDTLKGLGVTDVTGTGSATIDPSYAVDMGVGIDLAPGLALADRFYLTNGDNGAVATFDAPMTADLHVQAIASALRLKLDDANADGSVDLLERKDEGKPMLAVALTDPDKNGRVTLSELSAAN